MVSILFKWLLLASMQMNSGNHTAHPIFVSVVNIEHNARDKDLEVSCKIFTDDFEKALRKIYNTHIDLLDSRMKTSMNKYVNDYIQKHFKLLADGHLQTLKFLGYEQDEEGINCFLEADNVAAVKTLTVTDNILYEYQDQQMGLIHCTVNGILKNYKLNNPDEKAVFNF